MDPAARLDHDSSDGGDETAALTDLLRAWSDGERDDLDRLVPKVIDDLHRIARHQLRRVGSTPTLQPTLIVNEAYMRFAQRKDPVAFRSRQHFFAFSSKVIRDLLVDHLRKRGCSKRGGDREQIDWERVADHARSDEPVPLEEVLEIHDLLSTLERRDPRRGQVVELRYFGGLTMPEIAEVTGRSVATVERDWQVARRWLARELTRSASSAARPPAARSGREAARLAE